MQWGIYGARYRVANWALSTELLLDNSTGYRGYIKPRQVVDVELGVHLEGEFSFRHPCLILRATNTSILAVPLTSKHFGKGIQVTPPTRADKPSSAAPEFRHQVDFQLPPRPGGDPPNGASALVEQIRLLSKKRVLGDWLTTGNQKVYVDPLVVVCVEEVLVRWAAKSVNMRLDEIARELESARADIEDVRAQLKEAELARDRFQQMYADAMSDLDGLTAPGGTATAKKTS